MLKKKICVFIAETIFNSIYPEKGQPGSLICQNLFNGWPTQFLNIGLSYHKLIHTPNPWISFKHLGKKSNAHMLDFQSNQCLEGKFT